MTYSLSENIQKGCLYLLTHDLDFFSQIVALVKPHYFDYPSYQRIFEATVAYYEKYKHLPKGDALVEFIRFTTPQNVKDDNNYTEDIAAIQNIDKSVLDQKEFILDLVEDFSKRGAMTEAIKKSVVLLKEEKFGDIEHLIKNALLVTRDVQVGQDYFSEAKERVTRLFQQKTENKFKTVFDTFNANLGGGLSAKELGIVVAPPGVGKSLYLVNQGAKSLLEGRNVLYISLEMSEDKIANRFDSVLTHLKNAKLKFPDVQAKLYERLDLIKGKTQGRLIIKEFPTGTVNVNNIRALLVQLNLHKNFKPDLIIVDYLELLRPQRVIDAEYMAQQRIAEELRGLASETKCLVWTASQTNRQARKVSIITDAELGDSYGKIRPADWVISLNQSQEEYDKGQMRVFVMKARDSKQHYMVSCTIDYTTLKMEESSSEECTPADQ
jgi:replicative DNA helicase